MPGWTLSRGTLPNTWRLVKEDPKPVLKETRMSTVPLIGGQHGVVYFGPRENPKRDRYWAERGLIHIEQGSDGALSTENSYESLSVREFLQRVKAINDMIGNSKTALAADGFAHADELARQQSFVEEAMELAQKAREQGMPPRLFQGNLFHERFHATVVHPGAKHQF